MKYTCPECQKIFKETPSLEDFTAKCPHCGAEITIMADSEKVEQARKEAERKAIEAETQDVLRQLEEQNAKAVALVVRSVKRTCPHCRLEGTWQVEVKPGVESFVVRCKGDGCGKKFTILNSSDDLITPLADILSELVVIRFRFGVLLFCLFVIPFIIGVIYAIIHPH